MKFFFCALFLVASAAADVSHLNNEYLPPLQAHGSSPAVAAVHHEQSSYAEQTNEIPQNFETDSHSHSGHENAASSISIDVSQRIDASDDSHKQEESFVSSNLLGQGSQAQEQAEASSVQETSADEHSAHEEQSGQQEQLQAFGSEMTAEQIQKVQPFMAAAELINEMAEIAAESALPIQPAIRAPETAESEQVAETAEASHQSETSYEQHAITAESEEPLLMRPGIFRPEASAADEGVAAETHESFASVSQTQEQQGPAQEQEYEGQASHQQFGEFHSNGEHHHHGHHGHHADSGIDTQYGSNGGYIY